MKEKRDPIRMALEFVRELASLPCEWGCSSMANEQPCLRCRANTWLHTVELDGPDVIRDQRDELLAALRDVMAQFESGAFVRNTESDGCSDWAIKAFKPLQVLAKAKVIINKAEARDGR